MDRSERFYRIDRLLGSGLSVSFVKLREALGISAAQLKRDLQYMRDRYNAPIEYDRDTNGYRFGKPLAGPRYSLPGLWFSAGEIHALLTMQHLLENVQPGLLEPHTRPLLERLNAIVGKGDHSADEVRRRVRVLHLGARAPKLEHFETVAQGVLKRRRLRIRHWNRQRNDETERDVSPQRLVHYRDNWYLDTWCHKAGDLRSFSIDAIRAAELLDERAKDIPAREPDDVLKAGYGIFAGKEVAWAKLRFTPERARWVANEAWHEQQRARFESDGSYVLEVPYADDRELVMDILKFGPDVEVLAPEKLRKRVAEQLAAAVRHYS